jgi:hypothetical protein
MKKFTGKHRISPSGDPEIVDIVEFELQGDGDTTWVEYTTDLCHITGFSEITETLFSIVYGD